MKQSLAIYIFVYLFGILFPNGSSTPPEGFQPVIDFLVQSQKPDFVYSKGNIVKYWTLLNNAIESTNSTEFNNLKAEVWMGHYKMVQNARLIDQRFIYYGLRQIVATSEFFRLHSSHLFEENIEILDKWFSALIDPDAARQPNTENNDFLYTYEKILYVLGDTPESYYQIGMILLYLYLDQIRPNWRKTRPTAVKKDLPPILKDLIAISHQKFTSDIFNVALSNEDKNGEKFVEKENGEITQKIKNNDIGNFNRFNNRFLVLAYTVIKDPRSCKSVPVSAIEKNFEDYEKLFEAQPLNPSTRLTFKTLSLSIGLIRLLDKNGKFT